MEHFEQVREAVKILRDARTKIKAIAGLPDPFSIRATRTLTLQANAMCNMIGDQIEDDIEARVNDVAEGGFVQDENVGKPVTEILGRPIAQFYTPDTTPVISPADIENARQRVRFLIGQIDVLPQKIFYDECSDFDLRAVAKKLGVEGVTQNTPERMTLEWVDVIYKKHANNIEREATAKKVEEEEAAALNDKKDSEPSKANDIKTPEVSATALGAKKAEAPAPKKAAVKNVVNEYRRR